VSGRYYEDFVVGEISDTPGRTVTEADLVNYAGISGDFNPLHTDAEFASRTLFGQRIAHGPLGFSILMGLLGRLGHLDGTAIAMLGIKDWQFKAPIFIGDTIRGRVHIDDKRESKDVSRGVVVRRVQVVNQRDEVVQEGVLPVMVRRRPESV
jgi:acyl dehydratase